MKIALFHGYELKGSGSNEYNRYLAKALADQGNEVHIICREVAPQKIPYVEQAITWKSDGSKEQLFSKNTHPKIVLHQLPHGRIRPVYVTDKQRDGNVKAFTELTDKELQEYHSDNEIILTKILEEYQYDLLHVNHLVYQPMVVRKACKATRTPFIIFPHGSSIEYTVKKDRRFLEKAQEALVDASGLIIGNQEVTDRIISLFPNIKSEIQRKTQIVGVGVDTSLFLPMPKEKCRESITRLNNLAVEDCLGKSPEQSHQLINDVKKQGIFATQGRSEEYLNDYPDQDFCQKTNQIPWDHHILLFVGSLTVGKGLQTIITTLPEVLGKEPNTQLLIVGSGAYREVLETLVYAIETGDVQLLNQLASKGKDLDRNDLKGPWEDVQHYISQPENIKTLKKYGSNLSSHIHFLGRLDHSLLPHLFPLADLAIFPSVIPEAYPLVLMESLSNGVLPLVSYFSGFKDGVDDLVPYLGEEITNHMKIPTSPEIRIPTLAKNISFILQKANNQEVKQRLRKIAEEHYDWNVKAEEMIAAYKKVIKNALLLKTD
ncbi:MAG: glycosyltransferase family 4 protein [Chlamydiota bacterium]